ncbi:hypothetical protein D3C87_41360 [compost metagenome]
MRRRICIVLMVVFGFSAHSQIADSLYQYQSFELMYENDVFTASDRYYSQGILLNYENHNLQVDWLKPFFFRVPDIERNLFNGIAQKAYTPSTITSDSIQPWDRPYAATIAYTTQFSSRSKSKNYTLHWNLSLGFIGDAAFGEYTQTTIHRWIGGTKPLGWQHQLNNGLILNLGFGITKSFFTQTRWLRLEFSDFVTVGTLTNDMRIQGALKLGYIANRRQFYVYYLPELRIVAYDGTLQGALFAKPSEAAVPVSKVERLISEQEIGVYLRYNRFFATAHVHYQSRLFRYAWNHAWGGLSIGYNLWDNYWKREVSK